MVESWAVELDSIGPIYPFVGSEGLMVFLAFVAWIGWHVWQMRDEKKIEEDILHKLRESGETKKE
jgi:hypothetical protein